MKYSISILFLFLISCQSSKEKTFDFLNAGIENCNQEIEILNERYFSDAEKFYLENPNKNKRNKDNIDKIKEKSECVLLAIEQRINEIKSKKTISQNTLKRNTAASKSIDLYYSINEFKDLLDSLFLKDSIIQSDVIDKYTFTEFLNYREALSFSKPKLIIINIYELNLLNNKVQNISNLAIHYFIQKMGTPRIRSNKIEAAVIPTTKYLYFNEIYQANLYLVSLDTCADISVVVNNQTIVAKNGKAIYIDTNTSNTGKVSKKGILKFSDVNTDFSYVYPFNINFQIKDK